MAMGSFEIRWCISPAICFATDRGPGRTVSRYCAMSFGVAALLLGTLRTVQRAKATRRTT